MFRMDPNFKEDLIGIDVANPCYDVLVHESGLDSALASDHHLSECGRSEGQGIHPLSDRHKRSLHQNPSKSTGVSEVNLKGSVYKGDHRVGMGQPQDSPISSEELTTHAQAYREIASLLTLQEGQNNMFTMPVLDRIACP